MSQNIYDLDRNDNWISAQRVWMQLEQQPQLRAVKPPGQGVNKQIRVKQTPDPTCILAVLTQWWGLRVCICLCRSCDIQKYWTSAKQHLSFPWQQLYTGLHFPLFNNHHVQNVHCAHCNTTIECNNETSHEQCSHYLRIKCNPTPQNLRRYYYRHLYRYASNVI